MYTKLFHKDVFVPAGVDAVCNDLQKCLGKYFFSNHFSGHIDNQAEEDRSHTYIEDVVVECLNSLKVTPREAFEIELGKDYYKFGKAGWFVIKYCCRIPYSADQDLVVVIRPQYKGSTVVDNMIVTAWMNSREDSHTTLNGDRYCSEKEWLSTLSTSR